MIPSPQDVINVAWVIASGIFVGIIVAAPIGPVNLICIRRTLSYGPVNGFLSGLGAALGDGVFAAITAFGLTAIYKVIEGASLWLELFGGLFLLGYAYIALTKTPKIAKVPIDGELPHDPSAKLFQSMVSTFALTITNPATLVGFAALFAGLSSLAGAGASYPMAATLVASVIAGSALWWLTVVTITTLLHRSVGERSLVLINRGAGVVIGVFGVAVLGHVIYRQLFA